jgi:TonB-linked SusC/RagA family outer membrane protein
MKRKLLLFSTFFILFQITTFAQNKVIKGIIKDVVTNETLPGAIVMIEGTVVATTTDLNGAFTITADGEGKKLVITAIGYVSQTVVVDKEELIISLTRDIKLLKETVVTALGVTKETKSLGYSISQVGGDEMRKSGESNVIEALAGKASGVNVVGSGGTPGASSKIILRGNARFSGSNQPLIVIDGVPVDNETNVPTPGDAPFNVNLQGVNESNRAIDINPDDIESISILKGPAAAALYGSRAGAGAIIYTTKRGKAGKNMSTIFSSSIELGKVSKLPDLQNKFVQGAWKAGVPTYNPAVSDSWGPSAESLGMPKFDAYKDFFKTAYTYTNNIAIYGGSDNTSFRLSVGNTNQTGVIPKTGLKRTSVRLTTDSKLTTKITVGGTVDYTNTQAQRAQNGSNLAGVMLSLTRMPIQFNMNPYFNKATGKQIQYYSIYDNPLFTVNKNSYTDQTNRVLGNVYLDYKISDFFSATWKVGTDAYATNDNQYYAIGSLGDDPGLGLGQINNSTTNFRNLYSDLLLKFNRKLAKDIGFNGLIGYNSNYTETQFLFSRGRNLQIPDYNNLNNATELYTSNTASYVKANSIFIDGAFDYRNMLYLTLTGRNEWSTAFGKSGKSFFYPKADVAWVFSEATRMPSWLSFGKIRTAYSIGGIAPPIYSNKTYYFVPFFTDGNTNGNTLPYIGNSGFGISNTLGNGKLVPETVTGIEAGLDVRFFKGRLTLDATIYQQTSKNLLINQPTAASSGYIARYVNAGEMVNKGVELAIGVDVIRSEYLNWNIVTQWSKNVSKVTKLVNGVDQFNLEVGFSDIGAYAIVGEPFGVFYGTSWKRNSDGELLLNAKGLPQIDQISKKIGNPNPDWLLNINNTLTYKAWSFSFLWDIRKGGDIWNGTHQSLYSKGRAFETEKRDETFYISGVYDQDTPMAGQSATTAIKGYDGSGFDYFTYIKGQNGPAENAIDDGSWVRLRSVGLSYRFDLAKDKHKSTFKYVELGVSGRNILLFTKYHGVDPETSLTGAASNINGYDYFNMPGTKSAFFNLKFGL